MAIDKSQFIEQFKAETKEHIQNLSEGLLKLEKCPEDFEIFGALMREAHTIKGSASMMDYDEIANIAHKMEDAFESAPKKYPQIINGNIDLLLECLDTMESLLETKETGEVNTTQVKHVKEICQRIDKIMSSNNGFDGKEEENKEFQSINIASDSIDMPKNARLLEEQSEPGPISKHRSESFRVKVDKLNELINLSGEMLISRIRLNQLIKILDTKIQSYATDDCLKDLASQLKQADENFSFVTSNIQDEIMKLRMVPISNLFSTFPRAMRDLAQRSRKKVEFDIKGEDTQLDKGIVDQMKELLMHLLRNAVDHGIESPEERLRNNKPEVGRISLNAYHSGSQVIIEMSDDGRGIEVEKVKEQAIARNITSYEKISQMANEQIFQFLFIPGFTTAPTITETSGRGVGLDVVKENIFKLKGMIEMESKPGLGTTFIIKLPSTLMITESLLVDCGNEIFGIPIDNIVETARINLNEIETMRDKEIITIRDQVIPLARLSNMFSLPGKGIIEKKYFPVIIVQSIKNKLAILVDQIIGHHEFVLKALGYPLRNIKNISGGAILGNGKVVLILDIPSIVDDTDNTSQYRPFISQVQPSTREKIKHILLAEDTLSTAMLEKNILEAAGFSVVIARDGKEALNRTLQEKYDLVITDVLMPKINGFELTATLKKDEYYKNIPVIIVTTRESDSDKKKGLDSGADAYLLKKDFTSEKLLDTIDQLITVRN